MTNQYKVFSAVMNNFQTAIDATEASLNSEGATLKQNKVYMSGMEASIQRTRQQFSQLVNGKGGLKDFATFIINIGTGILKVINALGGLRPLLVAITGIIIAMKLESIISIITKMGSGIKTLTTFLSNLAFSFLYSKATGESLIVTMNAMNVSLQVTKLAIMAVTAVITIGVMAWQKYKQAQEDAKRREEEARQKRAEAIKTLESEINQLSDVKARLEDESLTREELNTIVEQNLSQYSDEISKLDDLNEARQRTIELINEEAKEKARELIKTGAGQYREALERQSTFNAEKDMGGKGKGKSFRMSQIARDFNVVGIDISEIKTYEEYLNALDEAMTKLSLAGMPSDVLVSEYNRVKDEMESTTETIDEFDNALDTLGLSYDKTTGRIQKLDEAQLKAKASEGIIERTQEEKQQLESLAQQYGITEEAIQEWIDEYGLGTIEDRYDAIESLTQDFVNDLETMEEIFSEFDFSKVNIDGIADAFDKARIAINEFNNSGQISIDNYNDLMSLEPEYLNLLFDEEGSLKATAEAERDLLSAKIDELAITQARTLVDSAKAYYEEKQSLDGFNKTLKETNGTKKEAIFLDLAMLEASGEDVSALSKQINAMFDWADSAKKNIDITRIKTDATKDNTKALKENVDALKKEVSNYEDAIKGIQNKVKDYINSVKKQKETEVDSIKDRINAIKDLKDAYDDSVDEQKDKLKEKQDAEDKYWQDQIDKLEKHNNALSNNLKLQDLLDNLAKARATKVKVYKEGQGFVYDVDQASVDQAQQALDEYYQQKAYEDKLNLLKQYQKEAKESYDKQIDDLTKQKKDQDKIYEEQIKSLENLKKKTEDKYDAIIDKWNSWLDEFEKGVKTYETEQNRLLVLQQTGIDIENENWMERLNNLSAFVNSYNSKLAQLDTAQASYDYAQSYNVGSSASGTDVTYTSTTNRNPQKQIDYATSLKEKYQSLQSKKSIPTGRTIKDSKGNQVKVGTLSTQEYKEWLALNKFYGNDKQQIERLLELIKQNALNAEEQYQYNTLLTKWQSKVKTLLTTTGNVTSRYKNKKDLENLGLTNKSSQNAILNAKTRASGEAYVKNDDVFVTGENPNKEIVLGSKANGVITHIDKGGGVVNAKSTKTVAGLLNLLGTRNYDDNSKYLNNNQKTITQNFSFDNITLPNVTDHKSFMESLSNTFSQYTIQYGNARN